MLLLSHRGYHVRTAENTLDAFEQAVALGVDGIETDVRLTADGQAVLIHDRFTPGGEAIASLTRAELELRVGHSVPTVEDAIVRWPDILWNLEIKVPEAVEAVAAVIRRFGTSRFLVSSFWHTAIAQIGHLVDVDLALLVSHRPLPGRWAEELIGHLPRVRTLVWNYEFLDVDLVEEARGYGFRSFVFGTQSAAEHHRLLAWPVAGVITDRPEFLRSTQAANPPVIS